MRQQIHSASLLKFMAVPLLATFVFVPGLALAQDSKPVTTKPEDSKWLSEDQLQSMSIAQLQSWADKKDSDISADSKPEKKPKSHAHMKSRLAFGPKLADKKESDVSADAESEKKPQSHVHMEARLGYGPKLADNSPQIPLHEEITSNGNASASASSSPFPTPQYYDDAIPKRSHGIVGATVRTVALPWTGFKDVLRTTGHSWSKCLWYIDEHFTWI